MEYVARERYKMAGCNQLGYPCIHSLGPFGDPEARDGRNSGEMLQSLQEKKYARNDIKKPLHCCLVLLRTNNATQSSPSLLAWQWGVFSRSRSQTIRERKSTDVNSFFPAICSQPTLHWGGRAGCYLKDMLAIFIRQYNAGHFLPCTLLPSVQSNWQLDMLTVLFVFICSPSVFSPFRHLNCPIQKTLFVF